MERGVAQLGGEAQGSWERRLCAALVIGMILFQRLVLPIGDLFIPLPLVLVYIFLLVVALIGRLTIQPLRFGLYAVPIGIILLWTILFHSRFSVSSLTYLVVAYLPFVFRFKFTDSALHENVLSVFQKVMVVSALIGVAQFVMQLLHVPYQDVLSIVPERFLQQGFATSYPILYGSAIHKSNGILFLEPSFFSQFLAIALIVEALYFRSVARIILFATAILCSFSGTGLLLVLAFAAPAYGRVRAKQLLPVLAVVGVVGYLFVTSEYGMATLARVTEFQVVDSSGYIRFVAPYQAVLEASGRTLLVGMGAGTVDHMHADYLANFTVLPKLVYEYGVIAAALFVLFIVHTYFRTTRSVLLSSALCFMYLMLSGGLLQAATLYLPYVLVVLFPRQIRNPTTTQASTILDSGRDHRLSKRTEFHY